MFGDTHLRQKLLDVLERERGIYGDFDLAQSSYDDPFALLIQTMLSHRTAQEDEQAAFHALRNRYRTWDAVQYADTTELAHTIEKTRYPDVKAKHIQRTLGRIHRKYGAYTLIPLRDMSLVEAMTWLTSLPGVGMKTASVVMLFAFKQPVLPVDTHVHRVMQRIGIIGRKVTPDKAHKLLLDLLPDNPETLYAFHRATMQHGQQVCHHMNPDCNRCPLNDLCEAYQKRSRVQANRDGLSQSRNVDSHVSERSL